MEAIDKLAWICIKDRKVLYVRSKGKDVFYNPGGKREKDESDMQALIREIYEELEVDLAPQTITFVQTFGAQAHGKPEGVFVEMRCYTGEYAGNLRPSAEIEEMAFLNSRDSERTSPVGKLVLTWLKEKDLID